MKKLVLIALISCFVSVSTAFAVPISTNMWMDVSAGKNAGDLVADSSYSLVEGGDFWVNIYVSGLPNVFTMAFDLEYDASQLGVVSSEIGALWPFMPTIAAASGLVQFAGGSNLGAEVGGDNVLLATIGFHCLAMGTSEVSLDETSVEGAGFYQASDYQDISRHIQFSDLEVSQVPIPGALLLLGSGLFGLAGLWRKIK